MRYFTSFLSALFFTMCSVASSSAGVVASFTSDKTSGCSPVTVTFTNSSSGASYYYWNFGDGGYSYDFNPTYTFYYAGTYTVVLTADDGFGLTDTASVVITINPGPYVSGYSNKNSVCPGEPITFSSYCSSCDYSIWNMGDGTTIDSSYGQLEHSYAAAGNYVAYFMGVSGSCSDSVPVYITVDPAMTADITYSTYLSDTLLCPGQSFSYELYDYNNTFSSVLWSFGDGNTSSSKSGSHSYTTIGFKSIQIIGTNYCGSSDTLIQTINVSNTIPVVVDTKDYGVYDPAQGTNVATISACPNANLNFNFNSYLYPSTSFHWDFGDGTSDSLSNPTHTYSTLGTYIAKLIVTNSCGNSDTGFVTVNVTNSISVTINPSDVTIGDNVCPYTPVYFNLSNYYGNYSSAIWNFGDGTSDSSYYTSHSYDTAGTYTASVIVFNNCGQSDTAYYSVNISNSIVPYINSYDYGVNGFGSQNATVCPDQYISFGYYDYSGNNSAMWYFGDGDTTSQAYSYHAFDTLGYYTGYVVVTNGCGLTDTGYVYVSVVDTIKPTVDMWISNEGDVCPGDELFFEGYGAANYLWDFGDGTTSDSTFVKHTYTTTGNYTITLIGTNSCGLTDTLTYTVPVNSNGSPDIDVYFSSGPYCVGDPVTFTPSSTNYVSYLWNFGDSTTSTQVSPSHSYTSMGSYSITLTVTNSCGNTGFYSSSQGETGVTIDTTAVPVADFVCPTSACAGTPVSFFNKSIGASGAVWDFGDGSPVSTSFNPFHVFANPGTYNVTLTASNSCGNINSTVKTVVVEPGATISGTVSNSGGPLTAGMINLYEYSTYDQQMQMMLTTSIDTGGSYTFSNIPEGEYLVVAHADSTLYPNALATYFGDTHKWEMATVLTALCNTQNDADINISEMPSLTGTVTLTGFILEGPGYDSLQKVIMIPGDPVPGVDVAVEQNPGGSAMAQTTTDSNGAYTFNNVPTGSYTLYVDIPGLGMDSTYTLTVDATDTSIVNLNFMVDSNSIYIEPQIPVSVKKNVFLERSNHVYPNPFKDQLIVEYSLKESATVKIEVINILGETVEVLNAEQKSAGNHKIRISGQDRPNGVYFLRLNINDEQQLFKVIKTK